MPRRCLSTHVPSSMHIQSAVTSFPDALYWDYDIIWKATEYFIRGTILKLKLLPSIPSNVPLSLNILPDRLPGDFNKPNYVLLVLLAIYASPEKKLKLSEIYGAIDRRYPKLEEKRPAYKRSLRHRLSLEPIFVNLKNNPTQWRGDTRYEDTRGNYWTIDIRRIDVPKRSQKSRKAGGSPAPLATPDLSSHDDGSSVVSSPDSIVFNILDDSHFQQADYRTRTSCEVVSQNSAYTTSEFDSSFASYLHLQSLQLPTYPLTIDGYYPNDWIAADSFPPSFPYSTHFNLSGLCSPDFQ